MKLLVAAAYYYYGSPRGIEPQYYYLYKVPEQMGIDVDFFDFHTAAKISPEHMRRLFLTLVKGGKYDAVFIATHRDEFDEETLAAAKKMTKIFAWNSDDEVRWQDYSQKQVQWYTYMVTNSWDVYTTYRTRYPQLLYCQWACTGFWSGEKTKKDIPFSFVGQIYGSRQQQVMLLAKQAGLRAFGKGTGAISFLSAEKNPLRFAVKKALLTVSNRLLPAQSDDTISFEEVNALWNRSKISFTPLESSWGGTPQIKSRVFDMGLSGTMMLAQDHPALHRYFEPEKEYIPFQTLEECAEKARFYLIHESAREKIADAYCRRTKKEHMWDRRLRTIFTQTGFGTNF